MNELIRKTNNEIIELTETVETARQELDEHIASADKEQQEYEKLKSWADLYDNCTFAAKKMIVSQFVKAVYVYRDYTLEVEFNVSFEDFGAMTTACEEHKQNEQPVVYVTA